MAEDIEMKCAMRKSRYPPVAKLISGALVLNLRKIPTRIMAKTPANSCFGSNSKSMSVLKSVLTKGNIISVAATMMLSKFIFLLLFLTAMPCLCFFNTLKSGNIKRQFVLRLKKLLVLRLYILQS